jgi:uncharacterized protein
MGRFSHEAVAVDPATSIAYMTEGNRNKSALHRFAPNDKSARPGSLENGGVLQAARMVGVRRADLLTPQIGDVIRLEWATIADPEKDARFAPSSVSDVEPVDVVSGPLRKPGTPAACA